MAIGYTAATKRRSTNRSMTAATANVRRGSANWASRRYERWRSTSIPCPRNHPNRRTTARRPARPWQRPAEPMVAQRETKSMADTGEEATSTSWGAMAQVNPRRSLILFAAGALLGLVIAGIGLFTAAGTKVSGMPAEDVALINGRHILRSDFIAQTQIETALPFDQTTKEQRLKVLNEMVDEEILVQRGLEVDLAASDPDVRAAEVTGVQLQVDADVLAQQPSGEQLQAYYTAHKDKYAAEGIMALRDLIIHPDESRSADQAMAKAKKAAEAFRKGRDSDDIAATFGLKHSDKLYSGDLFDFAVKIKLTPALYAAADQLSSRQASEP